MTIETTEKGTRETLAHEDGALRTGPWARLAWLVLHVWPERHRQRARLRELEEHLLRDIGLGREEALRQARKAFWRGAPWRQLP